MTTQDTVRGDMPDTTEQELDAIIQRAAEAADPMAETTPADRARFLAAAADALDAAAERLIPIAVEETHLTPERLTGELRRTTFQLRLFGDVVREGAFLQATIDHADPAWPMGPRPDLRRAMWPIGPVAVFAASNFPFAFSVAGGDTASALAAGCPVVVKANPGHIALSREVAGILIDTFTASGAPEGVFALVTGLETGTRLVTDPRIKAASFTGSLKGGRALFDLATSRPEPIPFFGELGSVNPAFVTSGASRERAESIASGFVDSMTLGVGQFCTKPGLLFVPADSAIPELVAALADGRAGAPMLNEHIRDGYSRALGELAGHPDVRVLAGTAEAAAEPSATVLATTAAALRADDSLAEEAFGPAAIIVTYESDEELVATARTLEGQLTASIHGNDDDEVAPALLSVLADRAGRVLWNGWPTGVSVTFAMHHGGPYPATTASQHTSVGATAIDRFLRPVSFQSMPDSLLPPPVRDGNPWGVPQRIDGRQTLPA